jgi:DNA-nicking Smr family endonuclease
MNCIEIDLHDLQNNASYQEIKRVIEETINEAKQDNIKHISIIVGKGTHSSFVPILPDRTINVLRELGDLIEYFEEPIDMYGNNSGKINVKIK